MIRLRARWVFPGNSSPLKDGIIDIQQGVIHRVTSDSSRRDVIDLGDVAIVPGLINTHTHLEFSHLTHPLEPLREFANWIQTLVEHRRQHPHPVELSLQQGLIESRQNGVTGIAEIATSDCWVNGELSRFSDETPQLFVFREILGLREEAIAPQLATAQNFLNAAKNQKRFFSGISPHAPYSLHPQLFTSLCQLAEKENVPLAMHLAETPEELQLLKEGSGPLVDLFSKWGLWTPQAMPFPRRPYDFLKQLACAPRVLVVHGNLLDDKEIDFLQGNPHFSVVYCPRTHASMQTGEHPWRRLAAAGINVALGTDSRASNPDLGIWNECLFLQSRFPELSASEILTFATRNGAQALGWEQTGTLQEGLSADLCVVSLNRDALEAPERFLFSGHIQRSMLAGEWITPF